MNNYFALSDGMKLNGGHVKTGPQLSPLTSPYSALNEQRKREGRGVEDMSRLASLDFCFCGHLVIWLFFVVVVTLQRMAKASGKRIGLVLKET